MTTNLRSVDAYVAVAPPTSVDVRDVGGFALVKTVDPIAVRMLKGYVLVDQVKLPNFSLSGGTTLLAAINKEKNVNFTAAQLVFGLPQPTADTTQYYNTTVLVTAKKASGYTGSYTFQYRRYALDVVFDGQTLDLPTSVGSTVHATLDAINTKFGIKLETTDVVDGPIANGAVSITLTVKSTSVLYLPGSFVTLGQSDADVPFATIAPVTDLPGFEPEA